ncbi:MAG: radical SAM protein [Candidatus Omnitrophota bacterium]|nr:MAG: radical SAM protein [Candidatus Omnitrophota bacterium]
MNQDYKLSLIEQSTDPLQKILEECTLCPRECQINRAKGERGYCGAGKDLIVYTAFLHKGEEPPISGTKGSGTIFFSTCPLKCVYCQNYHFSHTLQGRVLTDVELAKIMLKLQGEGAHNINLVTPTHFLPQILKGLAIAIKAGLSIPIIYNTSGYEKKEIIARLDGIIDVYLADMRYISSGLAHRYSEAKNYPITNQQSLIEMYRQRPVNSIEDEMIKEGLIIRHLVFPGYTDESKAILSWIKNNAPQALVSVMFQYHPYFKATHYPEINRRIDPAEYRQVTGFLDTLDLKGWAQELEADEGLAGIHFESHLEKWL